MSIALAPGTNEILITTPLPGVSGVASFKLPQSATVGDLRAAAVLAQQGSATAGELVVLTPGGDVVSGTSQLKLFIEDEFVVKAGDLTLTPVFDAVDMDASLGELEPQFVPVGVRFLGSKRASFVLRQSWSYPLSINFDRPSPHGPPSLNLLCQLAVALFPLARVCAPSCVVGWRSSIR